MQGTRYADCASNTCPIKHTYCCQASMLPAQKRLSLLLVRQSPLLLCPLLYDMLFHPAISSHLLSLIGSYGEMLVSEQSAWVYTDRHSLHLLETRDLHTATLSAITAQACTFGVKL